MDRKEAIEILQREIVCLNHPACIDCPNYKGCDPICTTPYDSEYIEAYKMAIQSLEVDEAYNLMYEHIPYITLDELKKIREEIAINKKGFPPSADYYKAIRRSEDILDKIISELEKRK